MGKPYSDDLRERVVAAIEAGDTRVKVAELYNMALSMVGGFIKRKRETGSVSPDKFGGYRTFSLEPHMHLVKELVAEQPDSTLAELRSRLAKEKVKVSQSAISRFLHHLNLTFKKSVHAAEQDRPDVAAAREALRKEQPTLDPKQLVFIDETAATTKMTRLYGRAPQGKRLVDKRCRTATGKLRLSYAGCAMMASPPRLCWMARWTAPTSWPMSNRSLRQL
jgi:transposase